MCMSSRTQATTKPARAPVNKQQKHIIDVYVIKNTSYH